LACWKPRMDVRSLAAHLRTEASRAAGLSHRRARPRARHTRARSGRRSAACLSRTPRQLGQRARSDLQPAAPSPGGAGRRSRCWQECPWPWASQERCKGPRGVFWRTTAMSYGRSESYLRIPMIPYTQSDVFGRGRRRPRSGRRLGAYPVSSPPSRCLIDSLQALKLAVERVEISR
jgi:hypothetical protein